MRERRTPPPPPPWKDTGTSLAEHRMSPEERQAIATAATALALVLAGIFAGVVATLIYVEVLVVGVANVG